MSEKPSFYQTVIKKFMALRCIGKRTIVSLQVPFHKANERRRWLPASKNRSTVKARFRHPTSRVPLYHTLCTGLKELECIKTSQQRITLLSDCDFVKSIQIRFFSALHDIKCVKGFCSYSNSRGFGRKIIDMITGIIQAMINDSIFWWGCGSFATTP